MAIKKGAQDEFANMVGLSLTQSAANTTTYGQINFPYSIRDKIGLIINRIEYFQMRGGKIFADGAYSAWGLTVSNNLTSPIDVLDPALVDTNRVVHLQQTAVGYHQDVWPWIKDFSTMPGGGLLVAPNPLFVFVASALATDTTGINARIWFRWIELSADEYWELVESRRIITN